MRFEPIGIIHSPFHSAAGTPIQPRAAEGVEGSVEVVPALQAGLKDLDGFERIWLIYRFDRARFDKRRLIVTPYLDSTPRGVFATRAPARPNLIGMSAVRLVEVRRSVLKIRDVDVLDGTPLLDIKPYVPEFDAFETANRGWLRDARLDGQTADNRFGVGRVSRRE